MLASIVVLCALTLCLSIPAFLQYHRQETYPEVRWLVTVIYATPTLLSDLSWCAIATYLPVAVFELLFRLTKASCMLSFVLYIHRVIGKRSDTTSGEYSGLQVETALSKAEYVKSIPPCCWLGPYPLRNLEEARIFLSQVWLGVLQFIALSPMLMVSGLLLRYLPSEDLLRYGEIRLDGGWLYICIASSLSSLIAVYWLLLFLLATTHTHLNLTHQSIWIIYTVFLTEVQKLVIAILTEGNITADSAYHSPADTTQYLTDLLCCGEMMIAAGSLAHVFPAVLPRN